MGKRRSPLVIMATVATTVTMFTAVESRVRGGVFETFDPAASIGFAASSVPPPVLAGGLDDLSVIFWIRVPGATVDDGRILTAGDALSVSFDGGALDVRLNGAPSELEVGVPVGPLPADGAWLLVACSLDAATGTLDAWVHSMDGLATDTHTIPGWGAGEAWPVTLGAADGAPSFTGHLGLTVIRAGVIDAADVETIWNDGAPHYFTPALGQSENLSGLEGVEWMIGHGLATNPRSNVNPDAEGAEIGDLVNRDNILVYSTGDEADYFMAGLVEHVTSVWRYRTPHAEGASWSGFFVREVADLELPEPMYVSRPSPLARRLADDDPAGLIRVITSANSRAARINRSYASFENWGHGGLVNARRESLAGVIVPVWRGFCVHWPGFDCSARREGDVHDSAGTPYASVAFGNFGSHGAVVNDDFPRYPLMGGAVVIEDGAAYIPKARPEIGTLFAQQTEPLTVRAMTLRFPGAGDVVSRGEKAITQSTLGTVVGDPITEPLDTTVVTHAMTARDIVVPGSGQIVLSEPIDGIEAGQACYVSSGVGAGGITMVVSVLTGDVTVLSFERRFPVDPVPSSSVLQFGPVTPHWVEHAWPGLDASDPEIFRGVRLTASGGPVAVLFLECFNPSVDGFVVGSIGTSGQGYGAQLDGLFSEHGVPYMQGLQADVWLQFFAHQDSEPTSMNDYAERIQEGSPGAEIWWCGDPDLDIDGLTTSIDEWHTYILEEAAAAGFGAVNAHNHPWIGTGNERAIDGHSANRSHLSGRGNEAYVHAVLDMLRVAALETEACPADLDGDGMVGTSDLVTLIVAWGSSDPAADLAPPAGDGQVNVLDLIELVQQWGDCP